MWTGCGVGRDVAHRQHVKDDECLTPKSGSNLQVAAKELLLLGRRPLQGHGHGAAAVVAAGDVGAGQGRRRQGESWCCPGDGHRVVDPGSTRAGRAGRAGCTWGAGWRQRGHWVGGRNGHRRHCSWAGPGPGKVEGTGQRSWVEVGAGWHRDNVRGAGQTSCPVPSHGVMRGAHSMPAPPSQVSWSWWMHYSGGAGLVGEAGWLRHGERREQKLGVLLGDCLGVFSERVGPLPQRPGR